MIVAQRQSNLAKPAASVNYLLTRLPRLILIDAPLSSCLSRYRIPQNPLGANPKGLIQALADLLLEAAGVETVQMSGGDHECQDHT